MAFLSTSGTAPRVDFRTALFEGLAPDGGLYMPEALAPFSAEAIGALRGADLHAIAIQTARRVIGDSVPAEVVVEVVEGALNFPIPLVEVETGVHVLELFHGPTLAFKDVGARFMAALMSALREPGPRLTVLVATSGDTGSAVAQAFLGMEDTSVVVLFPDGQVSRIQERQFSTLGQNVTAVAVQGTFDDCQAMVKAAFHDPAIRETQLLTSANSINVGRLIPQMFYYLHAWAQLSPSELPPVFATPSGNFGNLTAGLMAKRLGLPVRRFVAATNANDGVPDYLAGAPFVARPSIRTLSSAMDVGDPSNFARILSMYGGDRESLGADVLGSSHSDEETGDVITEVFERTGYVLDPHTAVGLLGLRRARKHHPDHPGIVLGTAHPAKFPEIVEARIEQPVHVPERLSRCLGGDRQVVEMPPQPSSLRDFLKRES